MPVVVLLDTSFSMNQFVNNQQAAQREETPVSRLSLAQYGLNSFFNYLSNNNKLEMAALLFFSNTCEVVSKFSRDYTFLRNSIENIQTNDKTNLLNALKKVCEFINEDWGNDFIYDVIVITDGNALLESAYLKQSSMSGDLGIYEMNQQNWPLPLPFKSRIHIVCMNTLNDPSFQKSLYFYKQIISKNSLTKSNIEVNVPSDGGQIWVPDVPKLTFEVIEQLFLKIANEHFKSYMGKLICGNLSCSITLFPNLIIDQNQLNVDKIKIYGFLDIGEISSPRVTSRHLVLPFPESMEEFRKWTMFINLKSDITDEDLLNMFGDEGRQPSFSVLLHGSLKVANMVALCQIGTTSSFGMLYSRTDNKKKSNLMLSIFESGFNPIPWISNFKNLGINETENITTNKVNKKVNSYVTWLQPNSIHNDIQKIMRCVRKLPDKYETILSELNRIQRSAIAFHFFDIIEVIIQMLEKEKSMAQKDIADKLSQIIKFLKQPYMN